jgi:hypothetical protein
MEDGIQVYLMSDIQGADCDTGHYLVIAKVRERLAVCKWAAQKIDTERFIVKKWNQGDIKDQYQVAIRNKSAALEDSEDSVDRKLVDNSGTRKGNIWKTKLTSLNQMVRIRSSETCIGA